MVLVELAENVFLDAHILEYRFDHQIDIGQRLHVQRGCQHCLHGVAFIRLELAALHGTVKIGCDRCNTTVQPVLRDLDQRDFQTRQQAGCRDSRPHCATADDTDMGDLAGRAFGLGNIADSAFTEEGMDQPRALWCVHALHEQSAFDLEACHQRLG